MEQKPEPQPGDLIEIFRAGYQHWAVYVGDGYAVHLVNPAGLSGLSSSSGSQSIDPSLVCRGEVKKEKLEKVVDNDKWEINNKLDSTHSPRPTKEIVKEALSFVGEEVIYSVHMRNCEHFATELRYGKAISWQVTEAAEAVGVAAICVLAVAAAILFFIKKAEIN
ncbi:phospholipase A and acyltransferase 3-like [Toxotes jaculatrix]|uniref:phospholipase A and acyltransferase 3-like n=1 Tax=Toxotes jaculatrix TaxID=941984 RepID=UPI001B3B1092|nr:phospholipase A and acyltransferase 3-like [Toxotes jaculatrix]XP_040904091.1 phospholipase A and acyltransferase 3-like [Toxotes jaculatrix]XP_040904092.1 phospholipase A and acyltransferase 3-like [Toxotes jaculatrix]